MNDCPITLGFRTWPRSSGRVFGVGLGTWRTFDVSAARREPLAQLVEHFAQAAPAVIDTSPMYGAAEGIVGDILHAHNLRDRIFLATKVWTRGRDAGIAQMEQSFRKLRSERIDLLQIHNLADWRVHLPTLRRYREDGRIRYIGLTHYHAGAYAEMEQILDNEPIDCIQINYSVRAREAERRLLPLAHERGIAVLVNQPFAEGSLLRELSARRLPPPFADSNWPQLLLRFVLSHPAVTCVLQATSNLEHLKQNLAAAERLPLTAAERRLLLDAIA